ncbi:MAG: succinate dehydrogenase / fumarate reductase cytochrome b subunit [Glaciecola sp.]|jgi:succinate dehydrogenase / fumarate reductase cytochrome b subunit
MATATQAPQSSKDAAPSRSRPWIVQLYGSALGKKYVMAITGIMGLGFVISHMVGNLKMYLGAETVNYYGEWLRDSLGYPILPHTVTLWILRLGLIAALVLHVHAAWSLTKVNHKARPKKYQSSRHYLAADFAGRSMRWTGTIVLLFIGYHLADLTWGWVNPGYLRGDIYGNMIASLSNGPVAALYIVANLALGIHLFHGIWSMFQSLGLNNRRFNKLKRPIAIGATALIVAGNLSFPIAIQTGLLDDTRPERTVLTEDLG